MTTPEDRPAASKAAKAKGPAKARVRRPQPERTGPQRSQPKAASTPPPIIAMAPVRDPAADPKISDEVSRAVRMGYDVIADNIRQGREAAERFRQGQYNMREVPGDLEVAGLRVLQLARELSTTTFDICEKLLKELGTALGAPDPTGGNPPFRPVVKPASPLTPAPTPPTTAPGAMKLTVRFQGNAKATSRSQALSRPEQPTLAADITVAPLASRDPKAKPIAGVAFQSDLTVEGLVAVVTVPAGQAPGVYSGLVFAKGQDVPLGVLTVEVAA